MTPYIEPQSLDQVSRLQSRFERIVSNGVSPIDERNSKSYPERESFEANSGMHKCDSRVNRDYATSSHPDIYLSLEFIYPMRLRKSVSWGRMHPKARRRKSSKAVPHTCFPYPHTPCPHGQWIQRRNVTMTKGNCIFVYSLNLTVKYPILVVGGCCV